MTTVNSKSEIKEAIKRGETEFYTSNKTLLYASKLIEECKSFSLLSQLKPQPCYLLASSGTVITITVAILTTTISLYAIYKGYDVEVDLRTGRIKVQK